MQLGLGQVGLDRGLAGGGGLVAAQRFDTLQPVLAAGVVPGRLQTEPQRGKGSQRADDANQPPAGPGDHFAPRPASPDSAAATSGQRLRMITMATL